MSDVVITGVGVISAVGSGASRLFEAMASNTNGFDQHTEKVEDLARLPWPVAKVSSAEIRWPNSDPWWINNRKFANVSACWAVAVAAAALETAGKIDKVDAVRSGVVMTVPSGEEEGVKHIPRLATLAQSDSRPLATLLYEEVPDFSYVRGISSQTGQFIAKLSGYLGSNVAVYGEAGASGLSAASMALRLIRSGELDRVIVVAVGPPLTPSGLATLDRSDPLGMDAAPGRGPFDTKRRGTLIGEGAAAILFEHKNAASRRGVTPLGTISCCESVCASSPQQAMETVVGLVLAKGDPSPDIWFSHGTGSVAMDAMQCRAVGPLVDAATTSTKGTIGAAFECAGLIDIAVAVEVLGQELVPPVGLLQNPDPELGDIDFVLNAPRSVPGARSALVTTLGHHGSVTGAAGAAIITRNTAVR